MRGLKAKTMHRVARETGIEKRAYLAKTHRKLVENPAYPAKGAARFLEVERLQIILGRCQRLMVQHMKKACPKGSFFGMPVRVFRGTATPAGTVQVFATREAALAAAGAQ